MWDYLLPKDYPDRDFILTGIHRGFRITSQPYDGPKVFLPNHKSALDIRYKHAVEQQILQELAHDRYVILPEPARITSALGAIPKEDGRVRLIHDCSRPEGGAVNDLALAPKFSYQSVADAMSGMSPGCYLAKIDLASAYRSVGIHPEDYKVSGLSWTFAGQTSPTYMADTCMMFGSRLAPYSFSILSTAVSHIMGTNGHPGIIVYLDDFLVTATTFQQCLDSMNTLLSLLRALGFAINYSKVIGPAQSLTFLGVQFDTVPFVASLPRDKMAKLLTLLRATLARKSVTKKGLQQVAGKLVWAARLIKLGRAHVRRLLTFINALQHPAQRTQLNEATKQDLTWWLVFADHVNGSLPIVDHRDHTPLCIDACSYGGGGFYDGQGFHVNWQDWQGAEGHHINYKEVLVLEPAAQLWAPVWANKVIHVHSDNQCAVAIINRGTAKDEFVMASLRRVAWLATLYNFDLKAVYYPGDRNVVADALSRLPALPAIRTLQSMLGHSFLKSCVKWPPQD